jgi:Ni/Fe-hydrogenase 1 B-type cytochrome subunit
MKLQEYTVWDRTTRLFHWINVLCIIGLIALGTTILNADALGVTNDGKILLKTIHVYVGYVFVLNLLWRLVWGRGYIADLKSEIFTISQGKPANYVGHTPLGRLAVTVILGVLIVQGGTGLILAGTDVYMPPLGNYFAEMVKADGLTADQVRPYAPETTNPDAYKEMRAFRAPIVGTHENLYYVILGLIVLHIAAVVWKELKHGGNIISAMFTGKKTYEHHPHDVGRH